MHQGEIIWCRFCAQHSATPNVQALSNTNGKMWSEFTRVTHFLVVDFSAYLCTEFFTMTFNESQWLTRQLFGGNWLSTFSVCFEYSQTLRSCFNSHFRSAFMKFITLNTQTNCLCVFFHYFISFKKICSNRILLKKRKMNSKPKCCWEKCYKIVNEKIDLTRSLRDFSNDAFTKNHFYNYMTQNIRRVTNTNRSK